MKRTIHRQYVLTQPELKEAIADYLKKIDMPLPPDLSEANLVSGDGISIAFNWQEVADVTPTPF